MVYGGGRAAIYVHKRHALAAWNGKAGKHVCSVRIRDTTVYSVYSPDPHSRVWGSPIPELLRQTPPPGRIVICGDMNLHHPLWDRHNRRQARAQTLLNLAQAWKLQLITPWGTVTHQTEGRRSSTIDHAWVSAEAGVPVATHEGAAGLTGSDHIPQVLRLHSRGREPRSPPPNPPPAFAWDRFNKKHARQLAKDLRPPGPMHTPSDVDRELASLTQQLSDIAELAAGRRAARPPAGGRAHPAWNLEVEQAHTQAVAARRSWLRAPALANRREIYEEANRHFRRVLAAQSRAVWRRGVHEASQVPARLWGLERWARLRSHLPPAPPKVAPLRPPAGGPPATSPEAKAELLTSRFFPQVQASPRIINQEAPPRPAIPIDQEVDNEHVAEALGEAKPWKAAGPDGLPAGFLRECGQPAASCLANVFNACLRLGHWPAAFRQATVAVLPKPGKTAAQKELPGAYRPIALLSCMGKALERIVADRLSQAAEAHGLFPDGQFGNRKKRSTEAAIKFVVQATRAAWRAGGTASLLQLDLQGAFDRVHHGALIGTLRGMNLPGWLLTWLQAFLSGREAALIVDRVTMPAVPVSAGVPQGSPLSPVLFLLFAAPLYDRLRPLRGQLAIGFADDTNILAFGRGRPSCVRVLEEAYRIAAQWAEDRGAAFEPAKSELIHFKRRGPPDATPVQLGPHRVAPQNSARFLGVWLDRRLSFAAHIHAVRGKLETQMNALTRLAASTWGCTVPRAREIYTKVIRSCIAYSAGAFHDPERPRFAKALACHQAQALRTVLGAYKATPIRSLELDAFCPPLDIYLNKRLADFERRMQLSGLDQELSRATARVEARLRTRRPRRDRRRRLQGDHWEWAKAWTESTGRPGDRWDSEKAAARDWEARWLAQNRGAPVRADRIPAARAFEGGHLRLYEKLAKAEGSALCQARTEKIGLQAFLYRRKVPGITAPECPCGRGDQTAAHLFTECADSKSRGLRAFGYGTKEEVYRGLAHRDTAPGMAQALVRSGWLPQFRVFSELQSAGTATDGDEHAWARRPPPQAARRRRRVAM